MSDALFSHTATLHLPGQPTGGLDRYNQPVVGDPQDVTSPAWWEPRTASEDTDDAQQYVSGYWLYLPAGHPGAPLPPDAQVTLPLAAGPTRFDIDGEPGEQPAGFVVPGYVRVALERVTG